ncbi:MAG: hypothetical protein K9G11_04745 [Rickettsiaceae bacterium]|nr:hypothetical protein [Rickettsiaceae bacterium]
MIQLLNLSFKYVWKESFILDCYTLNRPLIPKHPHKFNPYLPTNLSSISPHSPSNKPFSMFARPTFS